MYEKLVHTVPYRKPKSAVQTPCFQCSDSEGPWRGQFGCNAQRLCLDPSQGFAGGRQQPLLWPLMAYEMTRLTLVNPTDMPFPEYFPLKNVISTIPTNFIISLFLK